MVDQNPTKPFRLLSIDGGGINGVIPLCILTKLEEQTGKRCVEMFDCIGGTSSGGIISALLSVLPAKDILNLYTSKAHEIFTTSGDITGPTYSHEGLTTIGQSIFKVMKLSDAHVPTLLCAYDLERDQAFSLCSLEYKTNEGDPNEPTGLSMVDAILATSSAPTYFPPYQCYALPASGNTMESYTFIDGAVFANNPVLQLYSYASSLFPTFESQGVEILSLGTGHRPQKYPPGSGSDWTTLQWISPLINIFLWAPSTSADISMGKILGDKYTRISPILKTVSGDIDDISSDNINNLINEGNKLVVDNRDLLDKWVNKLIG